MKIALRATTALVLLFLVLPILVVFPLSFSSGELLTLPTPDVPIADGAVDALTIGFGIRNVENTGAACDEMHRVLAPGGRIAILEFAIPATPVVRTIYLWYFTHILPFIGRLVSRHSAAYEYLPASVGAFASPDELVTILRQHGFVDVDATRLTFGIVFLYTARRN